MVEPEHAAHSGDLHRQVGAIGCKLLSSRRTTLCDCRDSILAMTAPPRKVTWPLTRMDVAGAFGDIGVLFPIAMALITLNHLNSTAVFLSAGLTYILAGWYFQIPISVQPLKAVAAIALAMGLPPSAIASAGVLIGVLLALIAITNTAAWLAKLFTLPIVRGIQLGLGLLLAREGVRLILSRQATIEFLNGTSVAGWEIALVPPSSCLFFKNRRDFQRRWFCSLPGLPWALR